MISHGPGFGPPFIVCAFSATKKNAGQTDQWTNNPPIEMVMVVTVMLLMSDDSQGPRIAQSFIIFAFSVIKKNAGQTDRPTN